MACGVCVGGGGGGGRSGWVGMIALWYDGVLYVMVRRPHCSQASRFHPTAALACMQLNRTKWWSLVFLTTDRNMTKKMMRGANWLEK